MKYGYCVIPVGQIEGAIETIWLTSEPPTGLREAAKRYAATWNRTTVKLDVAGCTTARFKLQRPGFKTLTIMVTLTGTSVE